VRDWCDKLDQHHKLEEEHVFPKLAVKMPAFARNGVDDPIISAGSADEGSSVASDPPVLGSTVLGRNTRGYLHKQHRQIHQGLDVLSDFVRGWQAEGKTEVDLGQFKTMLDSFGQPLWTHMDEEVGLLGAENMRLYWSIEEMNGLPFKVAKKSH
jgi:hypothetical protein